jgi:hypothetical protein
MLECWRVQVCSNALMENNQGHHKIIIYLGIGVNKCVCGGEGGGSIPDIDSSTFIRPGATGTAGTAMAVPPFVLSYKEVASYLNRELELFFPLYHWL